MKKVFFISMFLIISIHLLSVYSFTQNLPYALDPDKKLWQYVLGNYTTDDGLPSNILNKIHQAKDGYIWITTYNGLVRFDGTKFTVFNSQNTDVFETEAFSVFAEDKNGRLLIGTHGKGIYTYKNGVFEKLGRKKFDEIIESILIDKSGTIWVGTRNSGLYVFKEGLYKQMFKNSDKIKSSITAMKQNVDGTIYFGTNKDGVFFYKKKSLFPIHENYKLKDKAIKSLAFGDSESLWIGTILGLYRLDRKQIKDIKTFKDQYITKVFNDGSHNIWVSTQFGLYRKSDKSEWQSLYRKAKVTNFSDFTCDHEGNMWIAGYRDGLFYLKDGNITTFTAAYGIKGGINTILEYEKDRFLIGSRAGYLYSINDTNVKPFYLKNPLLKTYPMHLFKDSFNNILVCTSKGILKIAPDKSETWLTEDLGLGKIYVRLVFEDSQKNLWIGTTRKGVIKLLPDNKLVIFDNSTGLQLDQIMSVSEDMDGNILIGSAGGGLSVINREGKIKKNSINNGFPSNIVFYTYTDKEGIVWVASTAGLIRIKDKTFFTYSKDNGFPVNTVFRVLEDNDGDLWITASTEIIRVARSMLNDFASGKNKKLDYKIYNKHSGIKQLEFSTISSVLKAGDGSLWFTSTNILIKIEPEKLPFNKIKPPVNIEHMKVDNNTVKINDEIILEPESKRITFDYTALHFFAPARVRFKYRLEGFEEDWIEVGNKRKVSYTNLSYGNYTFCVIASNNDDIWNKKGDSLSFRINPFWYESFLFRVFAVLLFFGCIFLVFKLRTRKLKKSHAVLENVVRIRTADVVNKKEELEAKNSELKASYEKMEQIARMDPLTHLSNRRDFLEKLGFVKAASDRNGRVFTLAIGDIDNFKAFNDQYGHDCGDFVLLSVANLLKETIRKQDYVGRWGGEEFVLLFPETDLEGGKIIVEKIRQEIESQTYKYLGLTLNITLTFGMSIYDKPGDINIKLKEADNALYKGKKSGRNRVEIF